MIAHWMRFFMIPFNPLTFFYQRRFVYFVLGLTPNIYLGWSYLHQISWQNNVCTLMSTPVSTQWPIVTLYMLYRRRLDRRGLTSPTGKVQWRHRPWTSHRLCRCDPCLLSVIILGMLGVHIGWPICTGNTNSYKEI